MLFNVTSRIACLFILLCQSLVVHAFSYTLEVTEQELQEKVSAMMPIEKQHLFVTVTLSDPDIDLIKGSNKIGVFVNISAVVPGAIQGTGRAKIVGSLIYKPAEGAFYFEEPLVETFEVDQLSAEYAPMLKELSQVSVSKALSRYPVYTLKDDKIEQQLAKSVLESIEVKDEVLFIHLSAF